MGSGFSQLLDASTLHRVFVLLALCAAIIKDMDLCATVMRLFECVIDANIFEFEECTIKLIAIIRLLDIIFQRLDQPAREPVISCLPDFAWFPVLKTAGVFLGVLVGLVEKDRMLAEVGSLGRYRELDLRAVLQVAGPSAPCDNAIRVRLVGRGSIIRPLE